MTSFRLLFVVPAVLALASLSACNKAPPEPVPEKPATVAQKAAAPAPTASAKALPDAAARSAAPDDSDPCMKICERAKELSCPSGSGQCLESCQEMRAEMTCRVPVRRFMGCLLKEPTSHWECDEDGMPAIKEGYCDPEQKSVADCMQAEAPPP